GADVSGGARKDLRPGHLPRLQPDVLPAVHPRLPRDAAALPRVSRGVPGAERTLDRGRVDPRRRLPAAALLLPLVAALWGARPGEPLAGDRSRVADAVPTAHRQLRAHAGRRHRSVRLRRADATRGAPGARPWLTPSTASPTSSTTPSSSARPP